MKNKFVIGLFSSALAVTMAVTPVFADGVTYGDNSSTSTQGGWYYDDVNNVQEGDPDGYVYGGGDTTGNYYAADIEDQYNQNSSSSGNNSGSSSKKDDSSEKKNSDSEKKEDSSSSASTEDSSSEDSSETSSEDDNENEAEIHGIDNPYDTLEKDSVNTCRVSASTEMPDGFEYDITAMIRNDDTEEYYLIHQQAIDDHIGHTYVPAGSYTVISISVDNDDTDAYPLTLTSDEEFVLASGETASIVSTFDRYDEINESVNGTDDDEDTSDENAATNDDGEVGSDQVPDVMPWRVVTAKTAKDSPLISYDGLSNDEYKVTVTITHSGGIGTAEYTVNCGYGTSDPAPLPSELKLTIPQSDGTEFDTGLTVYFPDGNYSIEDTYTFSTDHEWQVSESKQGTGVCYMAGVPDVDTTYVYLIKIVESGIPGKATYVLSRDNGETWGTETKLPANGKLSDGNVTIILTDGTYESGDMFYADIVGVGQKDYSTYVYLAIAAVAAVIIGIISFVLIKKKAGKDKYDLV